MNFGLKIGLSFRNLQEKKNLSLDFKIQEMLSLEKLKIMKTKTRKCL